MGNEKQFYNDVWTEWVNVYNRLTDLDKFINSEKFIELTDTEQDLIFEQFEYMTKYVLILDKRLKLVNFIKTN